MIDKTTITHPIQLYALDILSRQKSARFSDMKKPGTDSNLYTYHLKQLIKSQLVEKHDNVYRPTARGLYYIDHMSHEKLKPRQQPKIITVIIVKNNKDEILLRQKDRQPFITRWSLPSGKIHLDDESVVAAAEREVNEKTGLSPRNLVRLGEAHITITADESLISNALMHVFSANVGNQSIESNNLIWTDDSWRKQHELTPEINDLIKLSSKRKIQPFFAELKYNINLS